MSIPTGGNLGDATITVNANTDPAAHALNQFSRDAQGRLRDVRGRFVNEGRLINGTLVTVTGNTNRFGEAVDSLRSASLLLSPALIPIAAQAAPIAVGLGAASVAVGVFAAAAAGQVTAVTEAADAEKKYQEAIAEHGQASKQATDAEAAYLRQVGKMPAATRTTAGALSALKDDYREWSDSLADSTMPVATKALQTFSGVLPKLTPLVKGTSRELNRFVTIAAGGVASPGFDRFMDNFSDFAAGSLEKANDALIRFTRTLNTGQTGGGVNKFMEYVRANGPLVRDTLTNVVDALSNVLLAAADVGPGLLTVVNALAALVAAVPHGVITTLLQLSLAIKAVKLAAAGMTAIAGGMAAFTGAVAGMQAAAAGATGVLPRLAAAIGTLSKATKVALAGTGIGLLVIAISELSQGGRDAPPDIDKLTTSLRHLGAEGKVTGEAARHFGSDLDGLYGKVRSLTDPSTTDKVQQFLVGWTGWDSTPVKEAKSNLDAVDKALANLVKDGQADRAAAAVKRLSAEYGKGGHNTKEFTKNLDDYKAAVADAKFEQELAAQAMGLFGEQAQKTSAKLADQKASADGLRQAIQALNDVNRQGLGGMIGFEASIDSASKAARENAGALDMSGGKLNLNSEKARTAASALNDLAAKTDDAASQAREAGSSWETVNGIYARGRSELIKSAQQMGLTSEEAARLADQILKIPDKTSRVTMEKEDAQRGLEAFNAAVKRSPGSKSVTLKTLSKGAEQVLAAFGYKVTHLKDGSVKVSAATVGALSAIKNVQGAVNNLKGRTIGIGVYTTEYYKRVQQGGEFLPGVSKNARGGRVRGYARGGDVQYFPDGGYVSGPGSPTSDSVLALMGSGAKARVSDTEYVMRGAAVRKYGLSLMEQINSLRMPVRQLAGGGAASGAGASGMASVGMEAGRGLASGLSGATSLVLAAARSMAAAVETGVRQELEISSPSKKTKALAKDVGKGFIQGLTGSRDKIKSVSKDLATDIKAAFSGKKESSLLKMVSQETKELVALADKRDAVSKKIAEANKFATDTGSQAKSTGSLASIVQEDAYSPKYVKGQMQASLSQIKKFTANVQKLQEKGLNKDLLRQILEMGPEKGGAFAASLVNADKATIKEYNSLNTKINSASSALGKTGADMLYDSGKNAGKGFLAGLKGQQKDIENLMLDIAKGMQKSIKKALGIKSPSRVMDAVGRMTVLGLKEGITRAVPAVQTAMGRVSAAVEGGAPKKIQAAVERAASTPARGIGERRPRHTAAQGQTVNFTVHLTNRGMIGSQRQMEDWLVRALDGLYRTNRLPRGLKAA